MSYLINQPNGTFIINLLDGTADGPAVNPGLNSTDLNLIGHNYPNYGQLEGNNWITLLQNSANSVPPTKPLPGELWYNTSTNFLNVFNGTSFVQVTPVFASSSTPTATTGFANIVGSQWWDTVNQQFKLYNGSTWTVIGPAYSILDGISGAIVENIIDNNATPVSHTVVKIYLNGIVTSIFSKDSAFIPATPITGFTTINQGINLSTTYGGQLYGTAINAQQLGNVAAANFARTDITTTFAANLLLGNGLFAITAAPSGQVNLINPGLGANTSIISNVSGVSTVSLNVNGATGLITVANNPTTTLGVATKGYVDTQITNSIATAISPLAPTASPTFTGTVIAPTPVTGDISTNVATTAYVTTAVATANTALNSYLTTYTNSTVASAVAPLAPTASPTFTGTVIAPTPVSNDNSNLVATTSFVKTYVPAAIAAATTSLWLGSNKFVGGTPDPNQGNPGDFWFQL